MKNSIKLLLVVVIGCTTACSKWLDVQPESDIERSILFSTEEGFKEALLGVYTRNAKADLYGKELTIGTPEVLAQNYSMPTHDPYRYLPTADYKYNDPYFIERRDAIWQGLYHGIANSNLILEEIDGGRHLFGNGNYDLIKGEALALRGYLHFDALRLFAPAYGVNAEARGIPYVKSYTVETTAMLSVREALENCIADLEEAKTLLVDDPIIKPSYRIGYPTQTDTTLQTELHNPNLFLQNRRHRMNYFAICATLARIYLYKGDKTQALAHARLVIDAKKFPWTNATDFLAVNDDKKDRILYKELIFAWYTPTLGNTYQNEWFNNGTGGAHLNQSDTQSIYEVSGAGANDMRYSQWFTTVSVGGNYVSEIHKYRRNPISSSVGANLHYMVAPAIRLSEMYYIAAECLYASAPAQALALIDEVRLQRGIGQPLAAANEAEFINILLREYRKECYAEGQLFYAYKRLNHPIIGLQGRQIQPSNQIFVLPLPDDELIYGER